MKTYTGCLKYRGFEIELSKSRQVFVGQRSFETLADAMDCIDDFVRAADKRTVAMKAVGS